VTPSHGPQAEVVMTRATSLPITHEAQARPVIHSIVALVTKQSLPHESGCLFSKKGQVASKLVEHRTECALTQGAMCAQSSKH
jgi:hypothetical protein